MSLGLKYKPNLNQRLIENATSMYFDTEISVIVIILLWLTYSYSFSGYWQKQINDHEVVQRQNGHLCK